MAITHTPAELRGTPVRLGGFKKRQTVVIVVVSQRFENETVATTEKSTEGAYQ